MQEMNKLKIKLIQNRIIYIIYCVCILFIAYIGNRFLQMLIFILFFNFIQSCFTARFHAETIIKDSYIKAGRLCKIITFIVEMTYLALCTDLNVSLYSHLFLILGIATLNCLLQISFTSVVAKKLKYYNYEELNLICEKVNISYQAKQRLISHYIEHKTIKEIANQECVEEQAIKMSINRSKKKIENYMKDS